ncbi:alpha/beta hydrolase fold domain-containing protein [Candidatus Hydrogenedentota bacterium]
MISRKMVACFVTFLACGVLVVSDQAWCEQENEKSLLIDGANPTYGDVVYGEASGKELKLDVYKAESDKPTPAVIYIHGGGWNHGNKRKGMPGFLFDELVPSGITVVSISYRFSPVDPHPAQVNDATRAVQFVRHKAKEWNIDEKRIGFVGMSAGAHVALWVGFHDNAAKPDSKDPVEKESSKVACIVNMSGPADFFLLRKHNIVSKAFPMLLGLKPDAHPSDFSDKAIEAVSPVTYISADDPPVLGFYGGVDPVVPRENGEILHGKLRLSGVESKVVYVEEAKHNTWNFDITRKESVAFLKKQLKVANKTEDK